MIVYSFFMRKWDNYKNPKEYSILKDIIDTKIVNKNYSETLSLLLEKVEQWDKSELEIIWWKDNRILIESVEDLRCVLNESKNIIENTILSSINKIIEDIELYAKVWTYRKMYNEMYLYFSKKCIERLVNVWNTQASKIVKEPRKKLSFDPYLSFSEDEYKSIEDKTVILKDTEIPIFSLFKDDPFFINEINWFPRFSNMISIPNTNDVIYQIITNEDGHGKTFWYVDLKKWYVSNKYDKLTCLNQDSIWNIYFTWYTVDWYDKDEVWVHIQEVYNREPIIDHNKWLKYNKKNIIEKLTMIVLEVIVDCINSDEDDTFIYAHLFKEYNINNHKMPLLPSNISEETMKDTVYFMMMQEVYDFYDNKWLEKIEYVLTDFLDSYATEKLFANEDRDIDDRAQNILEELIVSILKNRNICQEIKSEETIDINGFNKYQSPKDLNKIEVARLQEILNDDTKESKKLREDFSVMRNEYINDDDLFWLQELFWAIRSQSVYEYFENELWLSDSWVKIFNQCKDNIKFYIDNYSEELNNKWRNYCKIYWISLENLFKAGYALVEEYALLYQFYLSYMLENEPSKVEKNWYLSIRYIDTEEINGCVYHRFHHFNYYLKKVKTSIVSFQTNLIITAENLLKKINTTDSNIKYWFLVSNINDFNKELSDIIHAKYDYHDFAEAKTIEEFEKLFMNTFMECTCEYLWNNNSQLELFKRLEIEWKAIGTIAKNQTIYEYLRSEIHIMVSDENNGWLYIAFKELFDDSMAWYDVDFSSNFVHDNVYGLCVLLLQSLWVESQINWSLTL